ncbi:sirohydrochlorin ferrochelatase [Alteribacillus persepolensis]|uniref:Sirohydrochlorin ferrochelatase n=1 Tax=Alteribacillus persepolensis TaxID=568899 RepID=A0A1G8C9P0_9BACI|nr:sirohydrochlorin chelatase [Alteribacillus persepolensis]SDH42029.1 sirohydrochlorin ferrochelatase [Alteribacillus persepolensis]
MQAVLFVGHGSRIQEGNEQLKAFVEGAKEKIDVPIQETCFLELAAPSIIEGAEACIQKGADALAVVPVFLLEAGHIKNDIPAELEKVKQQYPNVFIQYGNPFGIEGKIFDVLLQRLQKRGYYQGQAADILLVGRGSSDKHAIADFYTIASRLAEKTQINVETAFLAAASPTFDEGLETVKHSRNDVVYVLPYLLFTGVLMQEMQRKINKMNQDTSASVVLCDFLGFDEQLMIILKKRVTETMNKPEYEIGGGHHV